MPSESQKVAGEQDLHLNLYLHEEAKDAWAGGSLAAGVAAAATTGGAVLTAAGWSSEMTEESELKPPSDDPSVVFRERSEAC